MADILKIEISDIPDVSVAKYSGEFIIGNGDTSDPLQGIKQTGPSEKGYYTYIIPCRFPTDAPPGLEQQADMRIIFREGMTVDEDWQRRYVSLYKQLLQRTGSRDVTELPGKTLKGVFKPSRDDETRLEFSYLLKR